MAGKFGSEFASQIASSSYRDGAWTTPALSAMGNFGFHPGAHMLHYGSSCFEGLKAYRHADGAIRIFRLDQHVARMRNSAGLLCLPQPDASMLTGMISELVAALRDEVPPYPAALYLRPVLIGTEANIGSAARPSEEALLYVLASPVGDYFTAGQRALRLWVEDTHMRTTPEFGEVKTGGNYAAALRHIRAARSSHNADQVLFCPGGDVQETGAANFLLIDSERVITKQLDGSILPGITRASLLDIARDTGQQVEERDISIEEMLAFVRTGEAALSGTAAVLASVGALLHSSGEHLVAGGEGGPATKRLRGLLTDIQSGRAADRFGWLTEV